MCSHTKYFKIESVYVKKMFPPAVHFLLTFRGGCSLEFELIIYLHKLPVPKRVAAIFITVGVLWFCFFKHWCLTQIPGLEHALCECVRVRKERLHT